MKNSIHDIDQSNIKDIFNRPARSIVTVDLEKYKALLDDPAITDARKEEFLQALWSIVVTFVELGFGVHPLQEVCEPEDNPWPGDLKEAFDSAEQVYANDLRRAAPVDGLEIE